MVSAEFFDIFGFVGFLILLFIGLWMLISKKKLPRWPAIILLIIAILGIVIDGYIVFNTYLI
jgi:uncharacterized membrane protein